MTHDLSLDGRPEPVVVTTSRGAVEFASFGSGPAVLCLHGHATVFTHRREAQAEVAAFLSAHAAVSPVVRS
jgi:hypothetical protein